jgi:hypothetical protein
VAELLPDSELVVLPEAGHSIRPRTATRLTALLGRFLGDGDDDLEPEEELESEARSVENFRKTFEPAPR